MSIDPDAVVSLESSDGPNISGDLADLGSGTEMAQKKMLDMAHRSKHELEKELIEELPEEVQEEVASKSAMNEALDELKKKAPEGALTFGVFSTLLLAAGATLGNGVSTLASGGVRFVMDLFAGEGSGEAISEGLNEVAQAVSGAEAGSEAVSPEAPTPEKSKSIDIKIGDAAGIVGAATGVGAVWVGGRAAHAKYKETKADLLGENETLETQANDYRTPGAREAGEMIIAGSSLTSFPGVVAFIQDGISDSREVLQEAGVNTRRTLDGILKQGKRSAVDHAVKDAIESQEAMRG